MSPAKLHVRLSTRVAVEFHFTAEPPELRCEWDPNPPEQLTAAEHAAYIRARNAFISNIAQRVGGKVVVGDITPDGQIAGAVCIHPDGRIEAIPS